MRWEAVRVSPGVELLARGWMITVPLSRLVETRFSRGADLKKSLHIGVNPDAPS